MSLYHCVLSVFNPAEVGSEGKGYRWKSSSLDDTEEDELADGIWGESREQHKDE